MLKRKYREILFFQHQLVKNLKTVKQLNTNQNLLIALDLCQPHYQVSLITYLKLTKKNGKDAKKENKTNRYAILLGLKIIN